MSISRFTDNPKYEVTPTGVVFHEELTYDEIKEFLSTHWNLEQYSKWGQIDGLMYAKKRLGDAFYQLIDSFHYHHTTVINLLWIGRNLPPHLRVEGVSISHHQAVAPEHISDEDKVAWLHQAQDLRWSREELRRAIKQAALGEGEEEEETFPVPITPASMAWMVLDWLDEKIDYTKDELRDVLKQYLKTLEEE